MDFDKFISESMQSRPQVPPQIVSNSASILLSPDVNLAKYVVIDEKSYKAGMLYAALKGCMTLSFKHGKGLKITRNGEWVTLQIIDAGCGAMIKHQSAPYDANKARANNTTVKDPKGETGKKKAW